MDEKTPTVEELVAALRTLGCEGPAAAADVLDQVDTAYDRATRDAVLQAMAEYERAEFERR